MSDFSNLKVEIVNCSSTPSVVATLYDGNNPTDYDAAIVSVVTVKNGHDALELDVPVNHPNIGDIVEMSITSEIRVWWGSTVIFWGPIVRTNTGSDTMRVSCQGLTYYFTKRHVGDHERVNLISNGDFAGGLMTGWTENEIASTNLSASVVSDYFKLNGYSLRILGKTRTVDLRTDGEAVDSPVDYEDYHMVDSQVVFRTGYLFSGSSGFNVVICKAWFYIRDDGTYSYKGKPFDKRGFYIQTQVSPGTWTGRHWFYPIDDRTPRNEWVRAEFEILVEADERIEIRLYCPGSDGVTDSAIYWDAIGCYQEESLSFYQSDGKGTDLTEIIEGLIDHAQGRSVLGQSAAANKTDLNINDDPANASVGFKLAIAYQHADHENVWDSIIDITRMENGPSVRTAWNAAGTERYLKVGSLGTLKTAFNLQLSGSSSNIIDLTYRRDGDEVANSVLVMGDGAGPDREEAAAVDYSDLGVTHEAILRAPSGFDIDQLDEMAFGELALRKVVPESLVVRLAYDDFVADLITGFLVGDSTNVSGTWGNINWTLRQMELVKKTFNPQTGIFTCEFNPS